MQKELLKLCKYGFGKNILNKIKETKKQSTLTKKQREFNIINAFQIKDAKDIIGKKVILFDDIYTTGNTVNECSKILKKAGAEEITILTIAID